MKCSNAPIPQSLLKATLYCAQPCRLRAVHRQRMSSPTEEHQENSIMTSPLASLSPGLTSIRVIRIGNPMCFREVWLTPSAAVNRRVWAGMAHRPGRRAPPNSIASTPMTGEWLLVATLHASGTKRCHRTIQASADRTRSPVWLV